MREQIQQKKDKATCDKTDVLSFSVKRLFYFPKRVYDRKNKLVSFVTVCTGYFDG